MIQKILVKGAKVHNLKNIDLEIPLHQIVGIAGVSGSGKSSLALGVLYAEGSRRYLEALSTYTRRRMTQASQAAVEEGALRPRRPGPAPAAWGAWHPQHLRHRDGTAQLPAAALLKACQPPVPQRPLPPPHPGCGCRKSPGLPPVRGGLSRSLRRGAGVQLPGRLPDLRGHRRGAHRRPGLPGARRELVHRRGGGAALEDADVVP